MKNILLFTPKYPPSRGGAATFYSNLVETQQDQVNFFIVTEFCKDRNLVEQTDGIRIYSLLPRIELLHRYIRVPLEILVLFFTSAYLILFKKINLIHAHGSSFSVVGLAVAATVFQRPILNDCRDETFRPWIVKLGPTPIWFSCASNIDDILIRNGVPADKIVRSPVVNPVYVKDYRNIDPPNKINNLLYIGRIRRAKGVFLLLDAFEIIRERNKDIHLTVIGDGPDRPEFERRCRKKGSEEHITLTGSLSHEETLRRLVDADILVLPSESEGVPRVVLEGQDVGTPVVATAVGGIPDVIEHGATGILAEQTPESVAENVLRLVRDDELYRTVVENGVESADERSWERVGEQLCEGYERAIAHH